MTKLEIEVCPLMGICPINFKNTYKCFTENNTECYVHFRLWIKELENTLLIMKNYVKKSERSYNLCFTNYYIIHFWLYY